MNHTYDSYNMNLVIYPAVPRPPTGARTSNNPGRPGRQRCKIKHKKRKNVFENEFCEINWFKKIRDFSRISSKHLLRQFRRDFERHNKVEQMQFQI